MHALLAKFPKEKFVCYSEPKRKGLHMDFCLKSWFHNTSSRNINRLTLLKITQAVIIWIRMTPKSCPSGRKFYLCDEVCFCRICQKLWRLPFLHQVFFLCWNEGLFVLQCKTYIFPMKYSLCTGTRRMARTSCRIAWKKMIRVFALHVLLAHLEFLFLCFSSVSENMFVSDWLNQALLFIFFPLQKKPHDIYMYVPEEKVFLLKFPAPVAVVVSFLESFFSFSLRTPRLVAIYL